MARREELTKALAGAYKIATGKDLDIEVLKGLMDPAVRPQAGAYKVATGKDLDIEVLKGLMDPAVRPQLKRFISEYDFDGQRSDTFGGP